MTKTEVMALIRANQDERGIRHWNERCARDSKLKSFGIGLTRLRKMAKQIGRDHDLAAQLWKSDVYEARIIALLIDDPKVISRDQAEQQVEQLAGGHLAHVFSSCDAPLSKAPFVQELADSWMNSKDPVRRRCGFGLLYEISKSKKKTAPGDSYFLQWIEHINTSCEAEKPSVQLAMGCALMGIGKRNKTLNKAALKVARKIGPIEFDDSGKCDPFDVVKHLTSDYIREKLAISSP
jgi:3-methyladenine DNA glycosylase AlkD